MVNVRFTVPTPKVRNPYGYRLTLTLTLFLMTYIVSGGSLNCTHSLTIPNVWTVGLKQPEVQSVKQRTTY